MKKDMKSAKLQFIEDESRFSETFSKNILATLKEAYRPYCQVFNSLCRWLF